jgi:predicted MPP superfamily phosphohydrolase
VLGNHDWWLDAERVRAAFENAGIPMLDNTALHIEAPHCNFWLLGIGDYWEGKPDIEGALSVVDNADPIVAFTHNPDVFPSVPPRIALTIAGHTHGGQVYVPMLGRPIVPSQYGERYAIGHVVENGRHLFVASGVGTSIIPVRFLVPPEISIVELRNAPH